MYLTGLRCWDPGIYFNICKPIQNSDWLVTSRWNSVFHTCMSLELSPLTREVRQAHRLTYFKYNAVQNRSVWDVGVLKYGWQSGLCILIIWQFLFYYVARARHVWLITWKLAAFNECSNQNGSCYSAIEAPVLSSWVYYTFLRFSM